MDNGWRKFPFNFPFSHPYESMALSTIKPQHQMKIAKKDPNIKCFYETFQHEFIHFGNLSLPCMAVFEPAPYIILKETTITANSLKLACFGIFLLSK